MPKHYSNNDNSKNGVHTMPDGSIMSGSTHTKDSRIIRKGTAKKAEPKKKEDDNFTEDLKEGALKRMLKIKDGDAPLKIGELQKLLKEKDEPFNFRGKEIKKMTTLMKKRINTAITLIRMSKKK
jgi:hypothetical protein